MVSCLLDISLTVHCEAQPPKTYSALVPQLSRVRPVCILCHDGMCITLSFPLIDAFFNEFAASYDISNTL